MAAKYIEDATLLLTAFIKIDFPGLKEQRKICEVAWEAFICLYSSRIELLSGIPAYAIDAYRFDSGDEGMM